MRAKIKEVSENHQTETLTEEINLWSRYAMSLKELNKQFDSLEVKLTIMMLQRTNMQKLKEAKADLQRKYDDVNDFLMRINDVKINDVLSSTTQKELVESINENVPNIKKIYNETDFSIERMYKVIELFQKDLIKKLVHIFKEQKVLQMNSESFKAKVIKSYINPIKLKFETTSSNLLKFISNKRSGSSKSKKKYDTCQLLEKFNNRLEKIAAFIDKHEGYVKKYSFIYSFNDLDWRDWLQSVNFTKVEKLSIAYNVIDNADVFDLSPQGSRTLDDIIQSYGRLIEDIFKDTITVGGLANGSRFAKCGCT